MMDRNLNSFKIKEELNTLFVGKPDFLPSFLTVAVVLCWTLLTHRNLTLSNLCQKKVFVTDIRVLLIAFCLNSRDQRLGLSAMLGSWRDA